MRHPAPAGRVGWIEAMKGLTICLVLLHHVTLTSWTWLASQDLHLPGPVLFFDYLVGHCRMPAFFFCAGLVFAMTRDRGTAWLLDKRVLGAGWIILIWTGASYLAEGAGLALAPWDPEVVRAAHALWSPFGVLWFMYAMMICTLLALGLRGLAPWSQVLIALTLSILVTLAARNLPLTAGLRTLLGGLGASGFLFFIAGAALGPPALSRFTRGRSAVLLMAASLPPVLLYLSLGRDELLLDLLLMRVPSTLLLICGTRLLVEHCAPLGRALQQLGRVSLRIFLVHPFALALAMALWADQTRQADAMTTWLALLGLTAGGTFYLQGVFDRLSGGLAYRPPAWLSLASLTAPPPRPVAARRRRGAPSRPARPSRRGG